MKGTKKAVGWLKQIHERILFLKTIHALILIKIKRTTFVEKIPSITVDLKQRRWGDEAVTHRTRSSRKTSRKRVRTTAYETLPPDRHLIYNPGSGGTNIPQLHQPLILHWGNSQRGRPWHSAGQWAPEPPSIPSICTEYPHAEDWPETLTYTPDFAGTPARRTCKRMVFQNAIISTKIKVGPARVKGYYIDPIMS